MYKMHNGIFSTMTTERMPGPGRGRPKGDKRARTRASLIEAAGALVREQGFERTTLEAVARRAGMTRGAIYGNFKNRDELFMALAEIHATPIVPNVRPDAPFAAHMRALAEAVVAAIPQRRRSAIGALSFRAYSLTHEEMAARVLRTTRETYEVMIQGMEAGAAGALPMPARHFVPVLHALVEGLLMQRFLTPELVPDEVFYAAFAAFADAAEGVSRRSGDRPSAG
jgi:AcrR family transcriptional regulator